MNKYTDKSNADVNRLIAKRLGWKFLQMVSGELVGLPINPRGEFSRVPDFCGSMDAAMTLVETFVLVKNKEKHSVATSFISDEEMIVCTSSSPARAVAEAFLLWSDATGKFTAARTSPPAPPASDSPDPP